MEALNNLKSEAGLLQLNSSKNVRTSSDIKKGKSLKRAKTDLAHNQSTSKVFSTETHSSLDSVNISTSGSIITISESILKNRYSSDNQGPFDVHVQRISKPHAPLHPISVGRIIASLNTREATNDLVNDSRLKKEDLIAFIPHLAPLAKELSGMSLWISPMT
ncbi:uncharacterized protein LOC115236489 [Formica exsecta]|uniref:uncharacterized protein LOC115236489 n=1 Tax=Formica exsecta TaxID=72781 RepID=UPI001141650A|nr:uncharacterized protein LOC115236489 [Formica exsecta]